MNKGMTQTLAFDEATLANTLLAGPAAGFLLGAKLALYKVDHAITYLSLLADISANECDFNGYAQKTVTWLAVGISDAGVAEAFGTTTLQASTDAVKPQSAFVVALLDSTGATLYAACSLSPDQIPFNRLGDQALFTVRMNAQGEISIEVIS